MQILDEWELEEIRKQCEDADQQEWEDRLSVVLGLVCTLLILVLFYFTI